MKEIIKSLIDSNKVVQCYTVEECKHLVKCYIKNFNEDDTPFDEYLCTPYGSNTCIQLQSDEWTFCDVNYFKKKGFEILPYQSLFNPTFNKVRGFEIVSDEHRKHKDATIIEPTRGTSKAMAYDFYSPKDYIVSPNEIVKIWTDVKAYMQDNEGLIINVRSSMGGNFMLANTQGWVDADYYNNEKNDGNIGIFLLNMSEEIIHIKQGERIAQGMFVPFLVADKGNTDRVRKGGFGHTNDTFTSN